MTLSPYDEIHDETEAAMDAVLKSGIDGGSKTYMISGLHERRRRRMDAIRNSMQGGNDAMAFVELGVLPLATPVAFILLMILFGR